MLKRILNLPLLPWSFTRWAIGKYRILRDRHLSLEGRYIFLVGILLALMSLDVHGTRVYLLWSLFFGAFFVSLLQKFLQSFPLKLERKIARVTSVDAALKYLVTVENLSSRSIRELHLREEGLLPSMEQGDEKGIVSILNLLGERERATLKLELKFHRRGVYRLEALRAEHFCPLGLMRSGRTFPQRDEVIVYPRHHPIEEILLYSGNVHQPGGVPLASTVGESTEFIGLRDYRPGDQQKHICWKAWARLGEPAVREFQSEYFKRVALLLDTKMEEGREEDFEGAVSACASIAHYFEKNEYIIDLFAAGNRLYYLQAGRGLARLDGVLEVLALVEGQRKDTLPEIDTPLRELLTRLSALVLVSTDWQERHEDFYSAIAAQVPLFKPVLIKGKEPLRSPEICLKDPRLYSRVDPEKLREDLLRI